MTFRGIFLRSYRMTRPPLGVWFWKDLPGGDDRSGGGDWIDWSSVERRRRSGKGHFGLDYTSSHLQKSLAEKCESSKNGSTLRYQRPNIDKSEEKQLNRPWLPASVTRGDTSRHGAALLSTFPQNASLDKRHGIQRAMVETLGLNTKSDDHQSDRKKAMMATATTDVAGTGTARYKTAESDDEKGDKEEKITLNHIKDAVFRYENSHPDMAEVVSTLMRSSGFEDVLIAVIRYIDSFLKSTELEEKEARMENRELGKAEKMYLAQLRQQLEERRRHLANTYSAVVLGESVSPVFHHTAAGRWRSSRSHYDRRLYESVYDFLILAAWLTFGQQHWELICKEIGRVFRTQTFNMCSRLCDSNTDDDRELLELRRSKSLSKAQPTSRRIVPSLLKTKSPAMTVLVQTPKEKTPWLFGNHVARQKKNRRHSSPARILSVEKESLEGVGIIGAMLSDYDPITLSFIEPDECDQALKESNLHLPPIDKDS
ncbi:protein phosphatase 1 regulatory subunit 36-like [Oscarella lobularis]|uniref:protein phosphatase 1 regulatory subunit 36-like n=1 Tax=Oscarella lobularis TaxID=121494 RepID=UPI0033143DAD